MDKVWKFREFEFDPNVEVAKCIYGSDPHRVTSRGIEVSADVSAELLRFVREYASHLCAWPKPWFRLDLYPTNEDLAVLEVNTAFVDGWGTALNMARAVGIEVDAQSIGFPSCFGLVGQAYRPELELLIAELGNDAHICDRWREGGCNGAAYAYGRIADLPSFIWPSNGLAHDNKLHLAEFAKVWQPESVTVPQHYITNDTDWADIPYDVFLKFTDKSSKASERARFSVQPGMPNGKAPFLRRCYNNGELLAQAMVSGYRCSLEERERQIQLVVLTNGNMLTGYVQYGNGFIVNDNSIHGPLHFEGINM